MCAAAEVIKVMIDEQKAHGSQVTALTGFCAFALKLYSQVFTEVKSYSFGKQVLAFKSYVQYCSKVSWHSKLEPRDSILEPRCSNVRVSSIESGVSRIEFRGSRNKAFSNMQELERVSRKRFFFSRRKNNTVLLTPKVQVFHVNRYCMKTCDHTIADYTWFFVWDNLCSKLNVDLLSTMETYW